MTQTSLSYDPRFKKRLLDAILHFMYEPVRTSLKQRLDKLIVRNAIIHKNGHKAFNYKGKVYQMEDRMVLPRPLNFLDQSLYPEMQDYLAEYEEVLVQELNYVQGYITRVLNLSDHFPDYFALLPSGLHHILNEQVEECPCKTHQLSQQKLTKLQKENAVSVELIKQRMTYNLIL